MWADVLKQKVPHKLSRSQIILKVCPFCQNSNFNIEVSVEKRVYHCWLCNSSGTVRQLFTELGLTFEDDGFQVSTPPQEVARDGVSLESFVPVKWEVYHKFLESRGLEKDDITRYHIMTTDSGKFRGKIIFPLFEGTKLVYIIARDSIAKGRYYNINVSRSGILPYYLGKVDKTTVYLCEGTLDAISVNKLGYTAAILLGTILSKFQLKKIEDFGFTQVVVCLDGDALEKSIKIYDTVTKQGLPAKVTLFDEHADDPNSVFVQDKAELKYALKQSREITIRDRMRLKIR